MKKTTRSLPSLAVVAVALLLGLVAACGPSLYSITPAPPTRTAELHSKNPLFGKREHFARVSAGVALAFNCSNSGPCRKATAISDDPTIARVEPAHLNQLEPDYLRTDNKPPATFLLVGVRPGKTWVRIRSKSGNTKIKVTVVN